MIDPIPVKEELTRITRARNGLHVRERGGKALEWFSDHALTESGKGPRKIAGAAAGSYEGNRVIDCSNTIGKDLKPVASSTPGADMAQHYLSIAFRHYGEAIIQRAIELAQEDFSREA